MLLAGDSANQNFKPFIEGILPSIICGDIAGKIAYEICNGNDINNNQYLNEVENRLDTLFSTSRQIQEGIGLLFSKKGNEKYLQFFGLVTELLDAEKLEETENMSYDKLKFKLVELINKKKLIF